MRKRVGHGRTGPNDGESKAYPESYTGGPDARVVLSYAKQSQFSHLLA